METGRNEEMRHSRELDERAALMRVSTRDRDEMAERLQIAFAEGMLDENEYDERLRVALSAKTRGELAVIASDLPAVSAEVDKRSVSRAMYLTSYGSDLIRKGRWSVPGRLLPFIFKGKAILDLRAATLTERVTTISIRAYKSTVEVIVPYGVRVESRGTAYKGSWENDAQGDDDEARDARVVRVRGIAYKSTVVVRRTSGAGGGADT